MTNRYTKVFVVAAASLVSCTAGAVRYELKEGGQYALCRDYVEALNAADRRLPMVCKRRFPEEFQKFSRPRWEPLEPKKQSTSFYRNLFDIKERWLIADKNTDKDWRLFKQNHLEPALEKGGVDLGRARVDIDFSGDPETIIRARFYPFDGGCEAETEVWFTEGVGFPPKEFKYFVMNEDTGELDPRYGVVSLVAHYQGLFYYQGRPYLDSFSGVSVSWHMKWAEKLSTRNPNDPEGHLTIQELGYGSPERFGARDVCLVNVFYELER